MSGVDVKDILELDRGPEKEFITKDALMNSDKKVYSHSGKKMQDRQFEVVCFIILKFVVAVAQHRVGMLAFYVTE